MGLAYGQAGTAGQVRCRLAYRPRAFTLVEVLIVLAVVGILLGLLIPAVAQAREAARRAQCQNNLGQIGRALQSFVSQESQFPPAVLIDVPGQLCHSPQSRLLPFLEQQALYDRIPKVSGTLGGNEPPYLDGLPSVAIPVFVCPSDPVEGGNNYRACLGPGIYSTHHEEPDEGGGGAFEFLGEVGPAAFIDGLSNTVAMSERRKARGGDGRFSSDEDVRVTGLSQLGLRPGTDEFVGICDLLSGDPTEYHDYVGATWLVPSWYYTWYNHAVGPNSSVADCELSSYDKHYPGFGGVYKASSDHRGGVHCLIADGSVRFVSDSVDLAVWRAAATRAGGETTEF